MTPLKHRKDAEVEPEEPPKPTLSAAFKLRPSVLPPVSSQPVRGPPQIDPATSVNPTFVSRLPSPPQQPPPFADPSTIEGSGWIREPPSPPHAPEPARSTPLASTGAPIQLATSAFLRKPPIVAPNSPPSPSPLPSSSPVVQRPLISRRISAPLEVVVEEQEPSTVDPLVSLGLAASTSAQLASSTLEDGQQFDDADEDEAEVQEQREEMESVEEKVARMGEGLAEGETAAQPEQEEDQDDAFADADESEMEEGEIRASPEPPVVDLKPALVVAPPPPPSPHAGRKSVRFELGLSWTEAHVNDALPSPTFVDDALEPPTHHSPSTRSPVASPSPPPDPELQSLPTSPPLVPISTPRASRPDTSSWRPWPNSALAARPSARPLETPDAAEEAYLPDPPAVPIPSVTARIEGWLSSTVEDDKRDSQRRMLVDILNRGEPRSASDSESDTEGSEDDPDPLAVVESVEELPPPPHRNDPPHLSDPAIVRAELDRRSLASAESRTPPSPRGPEPKVSHLLARALAAAGVVGGGRAPSRRFPRRDSSTDRTPRLCPPSRRHFPPRH